MIKLKDLLMEDLDSIKPPGGPEIFFGDAAYTFYVYRDLVDNITYWVSYDYEDHKILSSNPELLKEIYFDDFDKSLERKVADRKNVYAPKGEEFSIERDSAPQELVIYTRKRMSSLLAKLYGNPTHTYLNNILCLLRRSEPEYEYMIVPSRIYLYGDRYYFASWSSPEKVIEYKSYIDSFLKSVGISTDFILFENSQDSFEPVFSSYNEFFNDSIEAGTSGYDEKMAKARRELHVNKAKLDVELLRILHSKPKDVDTLYQRLEKAFNMPIVKIKHIFSGIPLDRLISKKIREIISEATDYKAGDIIVGMIDDDLNIIMSSRVQGHDGLVRKYPSWSGRSNSPWRYNKRLETLFIWHVDVSKDKVEVIKDYLRESGYKVKSIQTIYSFDPDSFERNSAKYHSHGGYVFDRPDGDDL